MISTWAQRSLFAGCVTRTLDLNMWLQRTFSSAYIAQLEHVYHHKDKACSQPLGSWQQAKQCPLNPNCFVEFENKTLLDTSQEKIESDVQRLLGKCPSEMMKKSGDDCPHVGLKVRNWLLHNSLTEELGCNVLREQPPSQFVLDWAAKRQDIPLEGKEIRKTELTWSLTCFRGMEVMQGRCTICNSRLLTCKVACISITILLH